MNFGKLNVLLCFLWLVLLTSCGLYTETSYRRHPKEEYVRECGYLLTCEYEDNKTVSPTGHLCVTVFTPEAWGTLYYSYLKGIACEEKMMLKSVSISFMDSPDSLVLQKNNGRNQFYFSHARLKQLVKKRKFVLVNVSFKENDPVKKFVLRIHKRRMITGWKASGC